MPRAVSSTRMSSNIVTNWEKTKTLCPSAMRGSRVSRRASSFAEGSGRELGEAEAS